MKRIVIFLLLGLLILAGWLGIWSFRSDVREMVSSIFLHVGYQWLLVAVAIFVASLLVILLKVISRRAEQKPIQKTNGPMDDIAERDSDTEKMKILMGVLAVCAVTIFIGFLAPKALGINWGIVAVILSAAYLYLSFDEVNADEHVIVLFFGKILFQAKQGWIVVPAGFFSIAR